MLVPSRAVGEQDKSPARRINVWVVYARDRGALSSQIQATRADHGGPKYGCVRHRLHARAYSLSASAIARCGPPITILLLRRVRLLAPCNNSFPPSQRATAPALRRMADHGKLVLTRRGQAQPAPTRTMVHRNAAQVIKLRAMHGRPLRCASFGPRLVLTHIRAVFDAIPKRLMVPLEGIMDRHREILQGCVLLGFTKDGDHLSTLSRMLYSAARCLTMRQYRTAVRRRIEPAARRRHATTTAFSSGRSAISNRW